MTERWIKTDLEFVDPDEEIEIPREILIAALVALGGQVLSDRTTNEQLVAALERHVNRLPDTIADLDAALAESCSTERRAKLMARRIEIEQAAKAAPMSQRVPYFL
jgi:hypothetical protein